MCNWAHLFLFVFVKKQVLLWTNSVRNSCYDNFEEVIHHVMFYDINTKFKRKEDDVL